MSESTQKKIERNRGPRVQLTLDVNTGDAIEKRELPFVAGVMADLSGMPAEPLPKLKDRNFVNVDRDNFDNVMAGMKPRLQLGVDNKLSNDGTKLGVELNFKSMEDFEPHRIVNQVEPLKKLLELRNALRDAAAKLEPNDRAQGILDDILKDPETLQRLASRGSETEK